MTSDFKYCRTLELDKVLQLLAQKAALAQTKQDVLNIRPVFELQRVQLLLRQTGDAYRLAAQYGTPNFGAAENVNGFLTVAQAGGVLNMGQLLKIGELFRVIRLLKAWRENAGAEKTALDEWFEILSPNKYFEDKIFFCIKSEEEMNDNASPLLADLRRKLNQAGMNVRSRLDKIIKSSAYASVLQEAIVTQRQGRYVVPVKAEQRSQLPGLVHDTSGSGATLFVEPMPIVEINNEIRVLRLKEKEEVERILAELSAEAAQFAVGAKTSFSAITAIDACFAKAELAYSMRASMPVLNSNGVVELKRARHPLISAKTVVPVSLKLGQNYTTLVITGPNTGGKTVTLKLVGLLTLMACCGLMIPADDNSQIAVFGGVFADIGDEQSIEQSLSTFSSHMNNIIHILKMAGPGTLVLFDELCSGTDPVEGAALSIAILNELKNAGVTVVATTHYSELKSYAFETPGVENASCEFNVQTLKPTYRLLIGIPGRSNAFAISEKLGLPAHIVQKAGELVSAENHRFEEMVGRLEQAHIEAEKERSEAVRLRSSLEQSKKSAGQRLEEINKEKQKIIEKARQQANDMIEYARNRSNQLLNEMEELKKQQTKQNNQQSVLKARTLAKSTIREMEGKADSTEQPKTNDFANYRLPRPLQIGDRVVVKDFSTNAVVERLSSDGAFVFVADGFLKTKVPVQSVMLSTEKQIKAAQPRTRKVSAKGLKPSQREQKRELDIRGFASDEGLLEVDRFLDEAVLAGVQTVYIIHGKGTGVLKKAVRAHLRRHPSVQSSRPGVFGEGEDGVTVVELK